MFAHGITNHLWTGLRAYVLRLDVGSQALRIVYCCAYVERTGCINDKCVVDRSFPCCASQCDDGCGTTISSTFPDHRLLHAQPVIVHRSECIVRFRASCLHYCNHAPLLIQASMHQAPQNLASKLQFVLTLRHLPAKRCGFFTLAKMWGSNCESGVNKPTHFLSDLS